MPRDRLVGRTSDLTRLSQLAEAGERLVTLVGPAGIGKTRLARELLLRLEPSVGSLGEVRFCDVRDAHTVEDLVHAVLWNLGFSDQALKRDSDVVEALALALADRGKLLLILDNFEHLVGSSARAIDTLLDHAPELRLIVTSRQRLHCRGEVVHQVAPLSTVDADGHQSEAVELLLERAARASHEWRPTPEDGAELSRLVQELDGSPLAIELAAPRLVLLGAAELRRRLSDRFDVLRGHEGDDEQDVWRSIERSWRTLNDVEQHCLAQCSVFRGGFELEDAEATVDLGQAQGETTLHVINALADKSLLSMTFDIARSRARFDCLLSIRDYASKKLHELGLREPTEVRHSTYFARRSSQQTETFMNDRSPDARRWFRRQHANLLAAIDYARDLNVSFDLLTTLGMIPGLFVVPTLLNALDRHLSREGGELSKRLYALQTRAKVRRWRGEYERAKADCQEVLRLSADARLRGLALTNLARIESLLGDLTQAERYALQAADPVRNGQNRSDEIDLLGAHGWILMGLGRTRECRIAWQRALILAERESLYLEGQREGALGGLSIDEGRWDEVDLHFSNALSIAEQLEDDGQRALFTLRWAGGWHARGNFEKGRTLYEEGIARSRALGLQPDWATGYLGVLEHETGHLERALPLLERCVGMYKDMHEHRFLHLFEAYLAGAEAESGNLALARRLMQKAEDGIASSSDRALATAVELQRGVLNVHLAAAGANEDVGALSAQARLIHTRGREAAHSSFDVRISLRLLDRALGQRVGDTNSTSAATHNELIVGKHAAWFIAPGTSRQDLSRKRVLRRVFLALVVAHKEDPNKLVTHEQLVRRIWGAQPPEEAVARNRLYVAIATLRRLTGDNLLVTHRLGYQLEPSLRVVIKE